MNPFFDEKNVGGRLHRLARETGSAELAEAATAFAPHSGKARVRVLALLGVASTTRNFSTKIRAEIALLRADVGAY